MIALVDIQDNIIEYAGKVYVEVPDGMDVVFVPEGEMAEFDMMTGYVGRVASD